MKIDVENPQIQTLIFSVIFLILLFLTARKVKKDGMFDLTLTNEIKGFAMLAIVFSHIGYFLSNNTEFLFPLSVLAGVGVNIFLFLSGFGLSLSALRKPLGILDFYKKRLLRLFLPMWIVLIVFLTLDFLLLNRTYSLDITIKNFFGFFPRADLFLDLNSPLWYFSLILFYYLVFPIFFNKKIPHISALGIFLFGYLFTKLNLPVDEDVLKLYKLHTFAFPLGILFAISLSEEHGQIFHTTRAFFSEKLHNLKPLKTIIKTSLRFLIVSVFVYTAYHSGVEDGIRIEQTISLVTMTCIVLIFMFKNISFKLFEIFGKYSYEIYLLHWPILSRFDLLYKTLDPFLATLLYLGLFLGISLVLFNLVERVFKRFSS